MGGRRMVVRKLTAIGRAECVDVADLLRRISRIRHTTQSGAYLLGDSDGFIYILHEQSSMSDDMVLGLGRMIINLYGVYRMPTAEKIAADLLRHFARIKTDT
jgi:hypothetical protein